MNEEHLCILQQIQTKQDALLDAQSAIPNGVWAVLGAVLGAALVAFATVGGVLLAARAAEKRQQIELFDGRERQRRDEHRAKLEEALRLLIGIREWGAEVITKVAEVAFTTDINPEAMRDLRQFRNKGSTNYEMVVAILEIYSTIKNAEQRLANPVLEFKKSSIDMEKIARDNSEMLGNFAVLIKACDDLVKEVRAEIRDNYMP